MVAFESGISCNVAKTWFYKVERFLKKHSAGVASSASHALGWWGWGGGGVAGGREVYTGFAPWQGRPHRVTPHELNLNLLFRVRQPPSMD